jgi:hypothetical protein
MSDFDRRQFLKDILGKLVQTSGTVVVAVAAVSIARAQENDSEGAETKHEDIQERADRLAATEDIPAAPEPNEFLNGAFRNTPLGGFRNTPLGGFRNTPLGGFRNTPFSGFRNTPLGSAWGNGGWGNGGWGGFRNGGWPNGAWRNWW